MSVNLLAPDGSAVNTDPEHVESLLSEGYKLAGPAPSSAPPVDAAPQPMPDSPAPQGLGDIVNLYAPDGTAVNADAADVDSLLADGYRVASVKEMAQQRDAEEYGDVGSQVAAGAEGLAQGATVGLYGAGASLLAGDDYDRERRLREEYNPVTSVATNVVGAVAPALLSGGAGAGGAVARLLPAGVEANLGAKLATHLGSKAAAWTASRAGQVGARALATGLEGAADQAIRTVLDDAANGDVDVTAERMLDSVWKGGGAGVGLELGLGALGAAGRAVGRGAKRAAGAVGDAVGIGGKKALPGAAADALPTSLADDVGEAVGGGPVANDVTPSVVGMDPIEAQSVAGPLRSTELTAPERGFSQDVLAKARAAEGAFESGQQGATRTIRKDMDGLLKDLDEVDTLASIGAKRRAAEVFDGQGAPVNPAEFVNMLGRSRAAIDDIIGEQGEIALASGGGLSVLKQTKSILNGGEKKIVEHLKNGDLGSAYMVADDVKRAIGKAQGTKNSTAKGKLRDMYEDWRVFMEDEGLFGELAQKQKLVNPAWAERIRRQQDGDVGGFFKRSGEAAEDPFEALRRSNDGAIGSLLNQLGKAESEGAEEALRRYLRSASIDAETRAAAWGTPELMESAQRIKQATEKIESSMNAVALMKRDSESWRSAKEALKGVPFAEAAMGLGAGAVRKADALGMLAGRGAREAPMTPLGKLANDAANTQMQLEKAADDTVRSVFQSGTKQAARAAVAIASSGAIKRAMEQAVALQDPESGPSKALAASIETLGREDPALAQALQQKVQARASFLASKMPPPTDPGDPLGLRPGRMDSATQKKSQRYVEAAINPQAALQRLASGAGTREDVETLRALTPRLYESYVRAVEQRVKQQKRPPTVRERMRLSYSTGLAMDRAHTPETLNWYQQRKAPPKPQNAESQNPNLAPVQPAQQPSPPSGSSGAGQKYATRADRAMGG